MELTRKEKFERFVSDCASSNLLEQQIQELERDLVDLEKGVSDDSPKELLTKIHEKRHSKLKLELELNTVERRIIKFQLEEDEAE